MQVINFSDSTTAIINAINDGTANGIATVRAITVTPEEMDTFVKEYPGFGRSAYAGTADQFYGQGIILAPSNIKVANVDGANIVTRFTLAGINVLVEL